MQKSCCKACAIVLLYMYYVICERSWNFLYFISQNKNFECGVVISKKRDCLKIFERQSL